MKKILVVILMLVLLPVVSAGSVDEEIGKLVSYAEQYEMGNINYLELQIYSSLERTKINSILGSFQWEEQGPEGITAEAAENYFGKPKGYTKWPWNVKENKEVQVDEEVPWFEKIIFDGKRVQITFNAWPHVYTNEEQKLYYWTDFKIKFKKEYSIDLGALASEVKSLGESYSSGGASAEEVGKVMTENEEALRMYVEQNQDNCENVMNKLFSEDYKVSEEHKVYWEVEFYEGENLEVIMKLEMPECNGECQWPWIGMWFEPRYFKENKDSGSGSFEKADREALRALSKEELEEELKNILNEVHRKCIEIDNGEASWNSIMDYQDKLNAINEVLSEKYYWGKNENSEAFSQRKAVLEGILSEYGGYNSEAVEEMKYDLRLLTNQVEHKDAWCREISSTSCDIRSDACISGACTNALGGNEICDNQIDDDGDTVADCQDPDCAKQCGSYCRYACEGDCWNCHNTCKNQCNECWKCDRRNDQEACDEVCESSGCNSCVNSCNEQDFCSLCSECQQTIMQGQETNNMCYDVCNQLGSMTEAEVCKGLCDQNVLFFCNGAQQSFPCADTTYICEGQTQSIPCTIYTCEIDGITRKQTVPCGEEYVCGENMQLENNLCVCKAGYYDCDGNGACSDTEACGSETEICSDGIDNDGDYLVDCQDLVDCRLQSCGEAMFCYEGSCKAESEVEMCSEKQKLENGICVDVCEVKEDCSEGKICSYGICIEQQTCLSDSECLGYNKFCENGVCAKRESLTCVLSSECNNGFFCKENLCSIIECNGNEECGERKICFNYECIESSECSTDEQCMYGEECRNGNCVEKTCEEGFYFDNGQCVAMSSCSVDSDCETGKICQSGVCIEPEAVERPIETGESCVVAEDCAGERDICSNGVCKEIPEKNYEELVDEGFIAEPTEPIQAAPPVAEIVEVGPIPVDEVTEIMMEQESMDELTGFVTWITGFAVASCTSDDECNGGQKCDTFSGNCYCERGYFDCNGNGPGDDSDGCESTDPTCGGTRELCGGGCGDNQYCDETSSNCECNDGFYNCDGVWWDCEATEPCQPCASNEDCSAAQCDRNDAGRVINFGCFQGSTWMEDKGALGFEGKCVNHPSGNVETQLYFYSWGEPFDAINYYRGQGGNKEWCKQELENALRQRKEIESALSENFFEGFFDKYVQENPGDWESQVDAIYSMYWGIVENTRMIAENSKCLEQEYPELNAISLNFESEIGSVEIWEEYVYAEKFGMDVQTPFMKTWIFPPKEYLKKEFQVAAKEGRFPGDKEEGGPSPEELNKMREDPEAMTRIKELTQEYEDGILNALITINDENGALFNIDMAISETNLIEVKPVEVYTKSADMTLEIDFDFIYELIKATEEVGRVERPEWAEGSIGEGFDKVIGVTGIVAKITGGIVAGDIKITPLSKVTVGLDLMKMMFEQGN